MRHPKPWIWGLLLIAGCDGAFLHKITTAPPPNDQHPTVPTCDLTTAATITAATWSKTAITLEWTYDGEVAANFNIYYRNADNPDATFLSAGSAEATERQFVHAAAACVDPDRHCEYYVSASAIAGCEPSSSSTRGVYSVPAAATNVEVTFDAGTSTATISGTSPNGSVVVDHTVIQRQDLTALGPFTDIATDVVLEGDQSFSFPDAGLPAEQSYRYRVLLVATAATGGLTSAPVDGDSAVETCANGVSNLVAIRQNHTQILLTWTNNSAIDDLSCTITDAADGGTSPTSCSDETWTAQNLEPGTTHTYTVAPVRPTCDGPVTPAEATTVRNPAPTFSSAVLTDCSLTVTGDPGIDASTPNPAHFDAAQGEMNPWMESPPVTANATGVTGEIDISGSPTSVFVRWYVVDDQSGSGEVQHNYALTRTPLVSANPLTLPTLDIGDDAMTGRQVWMGAVTPTGCVDRLGTLRASLAVGTTHACVLDESSQVHCWGDASEDRLGSDGLGVSSVTPYLIPDALLSNVVQLAAGAVHSCAVTGGYELLCWGGNHYRAAVPDGLDVPFLPTTVALPSATPVAVAVGDEESCALGNDGRVYCWGSLGAARGNPTAVFNAPSRVCVDNAAGGCAAIELANLRSVALGSHHGCVLQDTGDVYCWGEGTRGQLGAGFTTSKPAAVYAGIGDVVALALGGSHSCALKEDGSVWCWGANGSGQLGNNSVGDTSTPQAVQGLSAPVIAIAAGAQHTCALLESGPAYCWGGNTLGQLGAGDLTPYHPTATPVLAGDCASTWAAIQAGGSTTCAVGVSNLGAHELCCWGADEMGQLGVGWSSSSPAATPRRVCTSAQAEGTSCPAADVYRGTAVLAYGTFTLQP